ncbi:MAG: S8 family peptidase [Anaerocolumna sp.]
MNDNERFKIISEEFADIIVEYNRDLSVFDVHENYSYNLINEKYAVLHIPVEKIDENSIKNLGYSAMPKCFGLTTYRWMDSINQYKVLSYPDQELTGKGVLVGFIDTGIDYTNPVFITPENTTKIRYLWDQTIESSKYPEGKYYGSEYTQEEINTALLSDNPYELVPSSDEIGQGTAIASVAAGFHLPEEGFSGVSTEASLIVVKLKPAKSNLRQFFGIPNHEACYQSNDMMMGIEYLINKAKELNSPIAICIGVGSSQGSHKGEDLFCNYLMENGNRIGVSLIVAAGNEGNQNHHYYSEIVPPALHNMVELHVGNQDKNFTMELWGKLPNLLTVEIISPGGEMLNRLEPDFFGQMHITIVSGDSKIHIDSYISETYAESQLILFCFKNIKGGIWKFLVSGSMDLVSSFHIWLPITPFISQDTYFLRANHNTTLSNPGNTINVITTGSYDPVNRMIAQSSGRGFTSTNQPKPDIAAPGINILVPGINHVFEPLSGTSMAAAFATGVAAGLLEWGIVRGYFPTMNSMIARYFITNSATRSIYRKYPNPEWGFGLIE